MTNTAPQAVGPDADIPANGRSVPMRPKDAATVLIIRRDTGAPRVLMGRRHRGNAFMPDKWVFPGGRIDRGDYHGPTLSDLRPEVAAELAASARLRRQDGERLARALARTAIRETFEETGLVIGRQNAAGIAGDMGALSYIARAITPPARHKRFDARFLMADAEKLASLDPQDSRELGEVAWFTLAECRDLDLPIVTRAVLDLVEQHMAGGQVSRPFWRWTRTDPNSAI